MTDPAEIRAEGLAAARAALKEAQRWTDSGGECSIHIEDATDIIDDLLADPAPVDADDDELLRTLQDAIVVAAADLAPAPVGLTDIDAEVTARLSDTERMGWVVAEKLAEENRRLSAAPVDDRERVPEGWRVEWDANPKCVYFKCPTGEPSHAWTPRLVHVSASVDPEEEP